MTEIIISSTFSSITTYSHLKKFSLLWILNPTQLPDDDWINQVPCIYEEEEELLASKKLVKRT